MIEFGVYRILNERINEWILLVLCFRVEIVNNFLFFKIKMFFFFILSIRKWYLVRGNFMKKNRVILVNCIFLE